MFTGGLTTIPTVTFEAGATTFELFEAPQHTAGTEVSNQFICGPFYYTILEYVSGAWVEDPAGIVTHSFEGGISGIQQRLTFTTQNEADEGQHQMRLKIEMGRDEYPDEYLGFTHYTTDFTMNIQSAVCNCNLLVWDLPTQITLWSKLMLDPIATATIPLATIDPASRTTEPAIRECYPDGAAAQCDETSAIVLVESGQISYPSPPMTFDSGT